MSQSFPAASATAARQASRRSTGIVIPVYLPPGIDNSMGVLLLDDNVAACVAAVDDPKSICLAVDGENSGAPEADELARRHGVDLVVGPTNRGKLHALRLGMERLTQRQELDWFATIDADGDHFANELVNLVRAGVYARTERGVAGVHVLGRRISRHRPMGWLRGELEELADRVLLDALAYAAATSDRPLRLALATTMEEYPDFHSGFKLFSRNIMESVFLLEPDLCDVGDTAYYRHGCEAVMTVEAHLAGAELALVNRTTLNEQPVSTFGRLDRGRLVADKIIWPCRRLGVPAHFLDQWLRNHMPRLLLPTLAPEGKRELLAIRELIAADYGLPPAAETELLVGPLFI
ncbi:MAG TPA: hypothetical protein DIC52_19685 [Candidatus Latescibacteria bacterium]|nr:hypothetical protein [Candidatus Latescibacterota bacterium]